jgi:hypothetical protein
MPLARTSYGSAPPALADGRGSLAPHRESERPTFKCPRSVRTWRTGGVRAKSASTGLTGAVGVAPGQNSVNSCTPRLPTRGTQRRKKSANHRGTEGLMA